jgi:hypothetical protein
VSWCWLALVESLPAGPRPLAHARIEEGGILAAWAREERPSVAAAKVDARVVDPDGDAAVISLVLAPHGVRLPFDDAAVQGARRAVLAGPARRVVSTLVRGDSLFAGAITAMAAHGPHDDPFARIFPARRLHIGPGLLGTVAAPCGPVIERYGGGNPWPWDRFGP